MENQLLKIKSIAVVLLVFSCISALSQSTFEDALKKAKKEDKRVIVDVYTDWCGWCVKMDEEAYSNKEVKKLLKENFIFIKLNAEGTGKIKYKNKEYTETELATYFEVSGYPTTIFLEPDGKLIEFLYDKTKMKNIPGYFKTDEFIKILEYIKDGDYEDTDLSKIV